MPGFSNSQSDGEADAIRQLVSKLYYRASNDDYLFTFERTQALVDLLEMGSSLARQAILDALLDTSLDYSVRSGIARSFEEERESWFLGSLRQVVADKADNKYVRVNAEEALANHHDKVTTELLIKIIRDTTDEVNVRRMAARVLGELGATEAVGPLIEALADSNYQVQTDAASALAKIGDPRAIEPLMLLLEQPLHDGRARGCAALYLTDAKLLELLTLEQRQLLSAFLLTALANKHESRWVRLHSAGALGRLGEVSAVSSLILALKDEDEWLRESIARALGHLGGDDAVSALIDLLQTDKDGKVRGAAIDALIAANAEDSMEFMREALSDESWFARNSAVHAAVTFHDMAALDQLVLLLHDPDPYIRSYAIYAVGVLGNEGSIPALQWVVENDEGQIEAGEDEEDDGRLSTMAAQAIDRIMHRGK